MANLDPVHLPSRQDVEALMASWLADPVWDLEHTKGFELYRGELAAFRAEHERQGGRP